SDRYGEPVLVETRCRICRKLLDEVVSAPATEELWASWKNLQICQRHGEGAGHGNIRKWQERQRRAGKGPHPGHTRRGVHWAQVHPATPAASVPSGTLAPCGCRTPRRRCGKRLHPYGHG